MAQALVTDQDHVKDGLHPSSVKGLSAGMRYAACVMWQSYIVKVQ